MSTVENTSQKSKTVLARITPQLDERVEKLIEAGGYRNRSSFFEEAIRYFVSVKEAETTKRPALQPQN